MISSQDLAGEGSWSQSGPDAHTERWRPLWSPRRRLQPVRLLLSRRHLHVLPQPSLGLFVRVSTRHPILEVNAFSYFSVFSVPH